MNAADREIGATRLMGRVLVVDDSADGRNTIARVLKCIGLDVQTAENGAVACQKALGELEACQPFDLVLMDIDMPVMDGRTATTLLRARGYPARIAALTAHTEQSVRESCRKAGCDDFESKPITFEKLFDLVERNLFVYASSRRLSA